MTDTGSPDIRLDRNEEIIEGQVTYERFYNESTGFQVVEIMGPKKEVITASGVIANRLDGNVCLVGTWGTFRGEKNFKINKQIPVLASNEAGVTKWLTKNIKGVGKKTAAKIIAHLGERLPAGLEDVEYLSIVVSKETAMDIATSWERDALFNRISVAMINAGFNGHMIRNCVKEYGKRLVSVVEASPWRLALEVKGVGFESADALAQGLGVAKDHPDRIKAAMRHVLSKQERDGHIYSARRAVYNNAFELLQCRQGDEVDQRLMSLCKSRNHKELAAFRMSADEAMIANSSTADAEASIHSSLKRIMYEGDFFDGPFTEEEIDEALEKMLPTLEVTPAPAQIEAAKNVLTNRASLLVGGPGVGKTFLMSLIVRILSDKDKAIALLAPTGKAAKRLSECCDNADAYTIHRALTGRDDSIDEKGHLHFDWIIVDETSMLDVHIGARLLSNIKSGACVTFVGDDQQLPSIGPGQVLRDMINSGVIPCSRLETTFRQSEGSQLAAAPAHITQKRFPPSGKDLNMALNYRAPIDQQVHDYVRSMMDAGVSQEDIQVITPFRRDAQKYNAMLQDMMNPHGANAIKRPGDWQLKEGDRVIQLTNNYELEVFNGETGVVTSVRQHDNEVMVLVDYGAVGERLYENDNLDEIALSYALTVHKVQGSEFPYTILALPQNSGFFINQNFLVTGMTRGKKHCAVLGKANTFRSGLENGLSIRRTELQGVLASDMPDLIRDDSAPALDRSSGADAEQPEPESEMSLG